MARKLVTSPLMDRAAQNKFVRVTSRLYKKAKDRTRMNGVRAKVRAYARDILPGLMIDRRAPVVLATEDEDFR